MKTLIIYAHPGVGHCSTVLNEVKAKLKDSEVLDLYKMKFNPILTKEEIGKDGHVYVAKENKTIQDKIRKVQKLIFIFPAWWGGMPAILKGFFDRIFTTGFALKFTGRIPKPLLKGKEATVFMTTGGPKIYHIIMGNRYKKLIKKDILEFSGIKTKFVHIGSCTKLTDKKKAQIKNIVNKALTL